MALKTMLFVDGSWMFHNKKFLIESLNNEQSDINYKKIPNLVSDHMYSVLGRDVDLVRTHFFGSILVNKPDFNSNKQKSFYKYLNEDCYFETEVYEIDCNNDPEYRPRDKHLAIALTSSIMYNAALDNFDVAAIIINDLSYIPLINRLRSMGKRVVFIGLRNANDIFLQSRTSLFDYPNLYLDDHIEVLELERSEHYRSCMSCEKEELTNWHGSEFYCEVCRTNDKRAQLRACDSCGREEETTWMESYFYCFDCRESHRKKMSAPHMDY
ncbi:MAG: NYN domain-containing protein [Flavobacteriales bacterium]